MLEVLNMSLQVLRTVVKNEINEISVCSDTKRDTGAFYTLISITDDAVRREIAKKVSGEGLFSQNRDFVGSFTYQDSFNLVFAYRQEARLCDREEIICEKFSDRKLVSESFLAALAETGLDGAVGELLFQERNIHVTVEKKVYFNYFLDFAEFNPESKPQNYYSRAADYVYEILSREYSLKYDKQIQNYPQELQAFYKKKERGGFTGFSQILTFIKLIPDEPAEQHFGFRKLWDKIKYYISWVKAHSMSLFMIIMVTVTVFYAGYQIYIRSTFKREREMYTSYAGLENIGEVYLGDEDI